MNKARTIILGASHWHVPLCADRIAEQHDVVGVSDPDPSRTEHLARRWDAPLYQSWEDVLAAHGDAELAYVFVPHDQMREVCLALIARRIPIVVEKPAGVSLQELVDVRVAADAAGVPIAVLFVQRGGPTDRWLARAGRAVYESTQFIAGPPDRYLGDGSPVVDAAPSQRRGLRLDDADHVRRADRHHRGGIRVPGVATQTALLLH